MKYFAELSAQHTTELEQDIFNTINEMIQKINDVQFIGVAHIIRMASDAISQIHPGENSAVPDMVSIRNAVDGLSQKMAAEKNIKLRQEFADTIKGDRFYDAMRRIITKGGHHGEETTQELIIHKLEVLREAQEKYQGYGALSNRDLVLVAEMIETTIEGINTCQINYGRTINPDLRNDLESLKQELIRARQPILECAIDILTLNKSTIRERSLNDSQLGNSFICMSVVQTPAVDINSFWANQINGIIKRYSQNPKFISIPQDIESLDEKIPHNPLSFTEDKPEVALSGMTLRDYLENFTYKILLQEDKQKEIITLREKGIIPHWQEGDTRWKPLISWETFGKYRGAITSTLHYYFSNYFYYLPATQTVVETTPYNSNNSVSILNQSLQMLQTALTPFYGAVDNSPKVLHIAEPEVPSVHENSHSKPSENDEHAKNINPLLRGEIIENIEQQERNRQLERAKQKFNVLSEKFKHSLSEGFLETLPQETAEQFDQSSARLICHVSKKIIDTNLDRNVNKTKKLANQNTEQAMTALFAKELSENAFEVLTKKTLELCQTYSHKLFKPAVQRIQALQWLYYTMDHLHGNDNLNIDEKQKILIYALETVAQKSHENHLKISLFGSCHFTESSLAKKSYSLLRDNNLQVVPNINQLLIKSGLQNYEDYLAAQRNAPVQIVLN